MHTPIFLAKIYYHQRGDAEQQTADAAGGQLLLEEYRRREA